jgi:hypothetical protein
MSVEVMFILWFSPIVLRHEQLPLSGGAGANDDQHDWSRSRRRELPFPLFGQDVDNGSAFIHSTPLGY